MYILVKERINLWEKKINYERKDKQMKGKDIHTSQRKG